MESELPFKRQTGVREGSSIGSIRSSRVKMELQFPSWGLIVSLVLPLFFVILTRMNENSKKKVRLPPGPRQFPIIGNLHNLAGTDLVPGRLRDLATEYGPIMHLKFGQISNIVVSNAAVAREFLKVHDLAFAARPVMYAINTFTYGGTDVAFAPYGEYWRQVRKICILELLSAKRVKSFHKVRENEIQNMIKSLNQAAVTGTPVDLTEMFLEQSNNITALAAFGKKYEFQDTFVEGMREALELAGGFNISDLFPSLEFTTAITGLKRRVERAHKCMSDVLDVILEDHIRKREELKRQKKLIPEGDEDLIHILLRIQEKDELGFTLTNTHIKSITSDMFSGGTETSSTTLQWVMSELLKNPETLKKATAEVRKLCGDSPPNDNTFSQLNYLNLVLKENFRLHPPLPLLLPRECREKCVINGYEIPEKTRVIVNMWAIGKDPNQWEEPEKFKPERFANSNIDYKGTNFELIPFGSGRRSCPGLTFGLASVEATLVSLLYHFDWKLPNGASGEELDMTESFGASMTRKHPLLVVPVIPK